MAFVEENFDSIEEGLGNLILDMMSELGDSEGFFHIALVGEGVYEVRSTFVGEIRELVKE